MEIDYVREYLSPRLSKRHRPNIINITHIRINNFSCLNDYRVEVSRSMLTRTHKFSIKKKNDIYIFIRYIYYPRKLKIWNSSLASNHHNYHKRSCFKRKKPSERNVPDAKWYVVYNNTSNRSGRTAPADLRSPRQRNRKSITAVLGTSYIISSRGTGTVSIN